MNSNNKSMELGFSITDEPIRWAKQVQDSRVETWADDDRSLSEKGPQLHSTALAKDLEDGSSSAFGHSTLLAEGLDDLTLDFIDGIQLTPRPIVKFGQLAVAEDLADLEQFHSCSEEEDEGEEQQQKQPGNGGAGQQRKRTVPSDWREVGMAEPDNDWAIMQINRQYGVYKVNPSPNYNFFRCTRSTSSINCQFVVRWAKKDGKVHAKGEHNHGKEGGKKQREWHQEEPLLPIDEEQIKERYNVVDNGVRVDAECVYLACRHYRSGCEFVMCWAKQGGFLESQGEHSCAGKAEKQLAVEWKQHKGNAVGGLLLVSNSEEQIDFRCKEPRCPLRAKLVLADGTFWTLGQHEGH